MHVAQALVALDIGGSELVATELAEFLSRSGQRVTVIAANGPLQSRVSSSGAQHLAWPIGKKRFPTIRYVRRLAEWLRQEQPDVLHAHSRLPAWICRLALRRLAPSSRPVFITTMHGHYSVNRYSAVMAGADRVVAVSEHIREYVLRNYPLTEPERVMTIHGGIDLRSFAHGYRPSARWLEQTFSEFPELRNKRLLCLPGRVSRYKGHSAFIGLVAALKDDYPDIHGLVVGGSRTGSRYSTELERLAERNGVRNRMTFTGVRLDIRDWMAASDLVFSLCSNPPEAFGRTVPEALHLGVPVIGWNHGGVQEVLAEMFPQGAVTPDSQTELLARTRTFLSRRPAVLPSRAFSLEISMNRHLQLYQAVSDKSAPESGS